jgi:ankyrin repeat protein
MLENRPSITFLLRKHKNAEAKELINEFGVNCDLGNGKALNYTILYENEEMFDFLIQQEGVDVNYLYNKKISPLMSAVEIGNYHMCEELLKRNADIHYADSLGNTALMKVAPNNVKLIKLLLDNGADPFLKTNYDFTPYDVAKRSNIKETMDLMESYKKE